MVVSESLQPSNILLAAERLFSDASYLVRRGTAFSVTGQEDRSLLAEDDYGIVGLIVYDTWSELSQGWHKAQARLVELMSRRLTRSDPKAWDGYLVLLTPAALSAVELEQVAAIRFDTSRIRKFVATGADLQNLADVERALVPLLPLRLSDEASEESGDVLDALPELLADRKLNQQPIRTMVSAFRKGQSLLEALHAFLEGR